VKRRTSVPHASGVARGAERPLDGEGVNEEDVDVGVAVGAASAVARRAGRGCSRCRAAEATGPERDRLWADHVAEMPGFGDYPAKTDRIIPMVVFTRIPGANP